MNSYLTRGPSSNVTRIHHVMKETVEDRLAELSKMVTDLAAKLDGTTVRPLEPAPEDTSKKARVAAAKAMLDEKGTLLVSDVRERLHVSQKTATRIIHAVAHSGAGVLVLEPAGNTARLRLYHPTRAILDKE